jgi:hypothetical protein
MNMPCVKRLVLVLMGALFASCSPTRMVTRSVTADDFKHVRHVVVDDQLYFTRGVFRDTLTCTRRTQLSPTGDGSRIPITVQEARAAGMGDDDMLTLVFHPGAMLVSTGDTLCIPLRSIDAAQMHDINPGFVAGSMIGAGAIVLLIVLGLAVASIPLAMLGR